MSLCRLTCPLLGRCSSRSGSFWPSPDCLFIENNPVTQCWGFVTSAGQHNGPLICTFHTISDWRENKSSRLGRLSALLPIHLIVAAEIRGAPLSHSLIRSSAR
ncbi:hypothetical protein XELAEV_18034225mg [Xenopus laevis]|uniref:Uncharacterized protein n=1 Tax=Xenopus laevis TaxID=8355 RepID=A0A974CE51_XENLA|nr:hypothetical protein XELAEV_18034225mg [Xenopus laevis]